MKYKFFSISKVTEFWCLSIIHLSASLPLQTHRCNTWDAVRADRSGVHFSNPFHFYFYIELYSSGGNWIILPTLQLSASLRVTPTYTEYKQGFQHRQFSELFHVLAPVVWMPGPAAFPRKKKKKKKYDLLSLKKGMQTENGILKHLALYYTACITVLKQFCIKIEFFSIFTVTRLMPQYTNKCIYKGI